MALTRSMLKSMGLSDEQISAIIEAHSDTVEGLKAERDKAKADAAELPDVKKELESLKGEGDYKAKYEAERKAFADYKAEIANKETLGKIQDAYRKLLTDNKVGEKHIDSIMRVTDFSKMHVKEDGTLSDVDKLTETIKNDWSGFITATETKGAKVETPPTGATGTPRTKDEILAIKDTSERQKAIAENHELFGF